MTAASSYSAPVQTMIYGSCVSRDTFEFLGDDFHLNAYVARQSMISAGTSARSVISRLSPIESPFQRRMVEGDLNGNLYRVLDYQSEKVELLVIDLVDERGGVIDMGSGRFASKLAEFWSSGGREASSEMNQIQFGSDEHFEHWTMGAQRFVGELLRLEMLERAVVIKAPWAELTDADELFDVPQWMMPPATANALYARYFDYLEGLGLRMIELPEHLARTSETHQWGISPYHFTEAAYEYIAAELKKFTLSLRAPRSYRGLPRRHTAQWGAFTAIKNHNQFADIDEPTGLFTVVHNGLPIDIMVEDNGAETTLVSFSAALGSAPLDPPVFTGRSASDGLGLNRIFISDPGLLCSEDLGLAWYLGSKGVNLTQVLVDLISAVQERLGAKNLTFFGMSGGGFASLNISHEFPGSLAVPVNPQTRILDYAKVHWQAMAESCLGAAGEVHARDLLEAHHRADQRRVYAAGFDNTVIYVQNGQDSHVSYQMIPWFEAIGWRPGAHVLTSRWGDGHVPPKPAELRKLLSSVAGVSGDWNQLARIWGANSTPTRSWVKEQTGR